MLIWNSPVDMAVNYKFDPICLRLDLLPHGQPGCFPVEWEQPEIQTNWIELDLWVTMWPIWAMWPLWPMQKYCVCIQYFQITAKYQCDGQYFRTARLPERIVPDIICYGSAYTICKFPDTGTPCITCHQKTDCRPDGQCNRCYMIDNPAVFEQQYWAPRRRCHISDAWPSPKFYLWCYDL